MKYAAFIKFPQYGYKSVTKKGLFSVNVLLFIEFLSGL